MKYIKSVNLWDTKTMEALENGSLKLQCGQWVRCGSGKPSRFVSNRGGYVVVCHDQGDAKTTKVRFDRLVRAFVRNPKI